jgi:hypothetical protein
MATPGRNEPCSCGSGKKYKHCCLGKDEAAARAAHEAAAKAETKTEAEQPPAEAAPATAQDAGRNQANRPTRHVTQQPWKRNEKRGAPKFSVPRRSGSS